MAKFSKQNLQLLNQRKSQFTHPSDSKEKRERRRLAENTAAVQKLGGVREGNPTSQSVWTPPSPLDTQLQLGRGGLSEGDLS
ncbi:hypothetical protein Celaphus_00009030 [Cervus elaphus hippelaphus]|uniref:Uncharacterized protein n=1 Tax=Cervus elaphus hippelaphus TaxID=46360 RepID=A0A212DIY2_CEREH|nr:hypothetical protein Celaphus_00009030 [Cervus elaphus hippelaphus]